jgi:hypothetical protein
VSLPGKFSKLEDIKTAVEAEQGTLTISMEGLRKAYGAGRLGEHVRDNISKALLGFGLSHVPETLPTYQEQPVRIYKLGTPVADLIDAALHPSQAHDEELREASHGETAGILSKIRELVCE